MESPIKEFQYTQNSNFPHELRRKIVLPLNFDTHKCVILVQSTEIWTHENKAIQCIEHSKICLQNIYTPTATKSKMALTLYYWSSK